MRGAHHVHPSVHPSSYPAPKTLLWRLLFALGSILVISWSVLADTPLGGLKTQNVDGCYCHCAKTKGLGSCVRMCELPKYASRWWAVTCSKQRGRASRENKGAGPRLKHRDRAEHAQLQSKP
jgi:hypothetical protein